MQVAFKIDRIKMGHFELFFAYTNSSNDVYHCVPENFHQGEFKKVITRARWKESNEAIDT